jgi:hypothetical protein
MRAFSLTPLVCMAAAVALALPAIAVAAARPQMYEMLGSVGSYRIGLNAVVASGHKTLLSAHYVYARRRPRRCPTH